MYRDKGREENIAYVDGQNLHIGTTKHAVSPWRVDLKKFYWYLEKKYHVVKGYYFLGYFLEENHEVYSAIQEAGFTLVFREHRLAMLGKKKGNVDSDIIFHIMKKLYRKEVFDSIVLVSGDGDYKMLVDFLIEEKRFKKILFPNRQFASSLYKELGWKFFDYLDGDEVRCKIEIKIKREP